MNPRSNAIVSIRRVALSLSNHYSIMPPGVDVEIGVSPSEMLTEVTEREHISTGNTSGHMERENRIETVERVCRAIKSILNYLVREDPQVLCCQ
jgi:hypothetical protein